MEFDVKGLALIIGSGAFGAGYLLKVVLPYTELGKKLPPPTVVNGNGMLREIRDEIRAMNEQIGEMLPAIQRTAERLKMLEDEAPRKVIAQTILQISQMHDELFRRRGSG